MNLNSRLNQLEKNIENNDSLFSDKPNFNQWSDEKLNQYCIGWLNEFHFKYKIKNLKDAEKIFLFYLNREVITSEDYKLFIDAEKVFWNEAQKTDSMVFLLSRVNFSFHIYGFKSLFISFH